MSSGIGTGPQVADNDFVPASKTMFLKRFDTVSSRVQASAACLCFEAIFFTLPL
jgi:hypothetical protein